MLQSVITCTKETFEKFSDMFPDHKILVTHDGIFHAHEVFQTCLFARLNDVLVVRTRDLAFAQELHDHHEAYVFDMGMRVSSRWLDHHQPEFVFLFLTQMFFNETLRGISANEQAVLIDVALGDNGLNSLDLVNSKISSFNKGWNENRDNNLAFVEAVQMAEILLSNSDMIISLAIREQIRKSGELNARDSIGKAIEGLKDGYIILNTFMPWQDSVIKYNQNTEDKVFFVIYPDSNTNDWRVQAVPEQKNSFCILKPIIVDDTFNGLVFVHPNKFIAGFESQQAAIAAAVISYRS